MKRKKKPNLFSFGMYLLQRKRLGKEVGAARVVVLGVAVGSSVYVNRKKGRTFETPGISNKLVQYPPKGEGQ